MYSSQGASHGFRGYGQDWSQPGSANSSFEGGLVPPPPVLSFFPSYEFMEKTCQVSNSTLTFSRSLALSNYP